MKECFDCEYYQEEIEGYACSKMDWVYEDVDAMLFDCPLTQEQYPEDKDE